MPLRVFVVAPAEPMVDAIVQAIASQGHDAAGATDPRHLKAFAAAGAVDVLVVTENMSQPAPDALAAALRPALPACAFVLITRATAPLPDSSPFDAAIKFPVPEKILASALGRAIRARRPSAPDHRGLFAEIEIRSMRLDEQTHYDVLGVPRDASVDAIVAAYDRLSLAFHPDRVRTIPDADRERALALYLRIGDAYRTLRSPNDRARYDMKLETGVDVTAQADAGPQTLVDLSRVPSARKYLDLAHKALASGNRKMALAHLRFAATQDADNVLLQRRLEELEAQGT